MSILKVVVERIPLNCSCCAFSAEPNPHIWYCELKFKMIEDETTRSSWCPLVVEEVCEWVKEEYEIYISPHNNGNWSDKYDYQYCPNCGRRIVYKESE